MPSRWYPILQCSPIVLMVACESLLATAGAATPDQVAFFQTRIQPVLVRHCYECHSGLADPPKGGLRLDSRSAVQAGGESGPAIVPGNAAESLLVEAIQHEALEMPPDARLPDDVIADVVRWIDQGAHDPRDTPPDSDQLHTLVWEATLESRRDWWSLLPIRAPAPPAAGDTHWPANAVDRFIVSRLKQQRLHPAPRSDRRTLIRRLTYALTGLPPTRDEVERFVADSSPAAWTRLVDRILASPRFGERWARHWMDVVRYGDTYGYEWDVPAKGAWRYRDYLIRAFNADIAFDQLIREHIAGDLLDPPRIDPVRHTNESLVGVMFFQLGEKRHGDSAEFNGIHQEMLDNKIDAFSKAFQATTVACARCHNHKIDAVSQREYYALAGVFMSSRWVTNTIDYPQRDEPLRERLKNLKTRLRGALGTAWLRDLQNVPRQLMATGPPDAAAAPAAKNPDRESSTGRPWPQLLAAGPAGSPKLEDPLYPWFQVLSVVREGVRVQDAWQRIAERYASESAARRQANASDFQQVADFREGVPAGWSVDGLGCRDLTECGDFTVAIEGPYAIGRVLPGGLFTHALSPRFNGAVRTPYLKQFDSEYISFEVCGGNLSAHRTVVDNAFLTERQAYLDHSVMEWLQLPTLRHLDGRNVYIELATKSSNPNFPPRVGLGRDLTAADIEDPRSWFGLTRVLLHDEPGQWRDELSRFTKLLKGAPPRSLEDFAARYGQWLRQAVEAWMQDQATPDDVRLINWMLDHSLAANTTDTEAISRAARLTALYREAEGRLPSGRTVNGMADTGAGIDYRLNIRGNYDLLGDPVPRGFLQVIRRGDSAFKVPGSGRRELAETIASAGNPLTARVHANRIWHWLFGKGIVTTPNNFGRLGSRPSHPALLDYLATRLVAGGWSQKKLIRSLILSETWRQSGTTTADARRADPGNRLVHHYPLRRLEAESIRDTLLAVSGRLDGRQYGPPVDPHRAKEDPQKRLRSGPLDGNGRRSIYVKMTIMEPPRFLAAFNQPNPKIPTGKRDVTNTPSQSLALLNDPFVNGQARHWARSLVARQDASTAQRLTYMFQTALGRPPTAAEIARWTHSIDGLAALHGTSADQRLDNLDLWKDAVHAMFNIKEFIYVP